MKIKPLLASLALILAAPPAFARGGPRRLDREQELISGIF